MERCVVASGNAAKLKELGALLEPFGLQAVAQAEFGIDPPDEPHHTFIENALLKARHASRITGLPAVADDSGICVPALRGEPGVYSARYAARAGLAPGDASNNAHLVSELNRISDQKGARDAYYVCALVWLAHVEDPLPVMATGLWFGEVIDQPQGEGGFGYDAHFWISELNKTAAELTAKEKNAASHRGRAMRSLRGQLAARQLQRNG